LKQSRECLKKDTNNKEIMYNQFQSINVTYTIGKQPIDLKQETLADSLSLLYA
jgi:hypothetical protein